MDCKFLTNGFSIQYHDFVRPCCCWQEDSSWVENHNINKVDLVTWHQHSDVVKAREELAQDIWPAGCSVCERIEKQGRKDSMRYNAESAYGHYGTDDITLEIRPGNICNFACQTCWTPASTRVAEFYKKAQLPDPFAGLVKNNFVDYKFLDSIAHRLKSIVVLGGEPFYDPKCLEFLAWCRDNTTADILAFTNGSCLDFDLIKSFKGKFTLVFSIDAMGTPAEYVRFGTDWPKVLNNFNQARTLDNVEVRVNITTSIYNFYYFPDLLDLLIPDWPAVVSFGPAMEGHYTERVIPLELRQPIIDKLETYIPKLESADIESGQKSNAVNAVKAIINNLQTWEYDKDLHTKFKEYVSKIDSAKKANFADYLPDMATLLE